MHLKALGAALAALLAFTVTAEAHHKPGHHMPPGQMKKQAGERFHRAYDPAVVVPPEVEYVCLVWTDVAGDPYSEIAFTEWLPRAEAELEADKGHAFIIYHPDFNTEQGCTDF